MDINVIFESLGDHPKVLRYLFSKSCVAIDTIGFNSNLFNAPYFEHFTNRVFYLLF